MCLVMYNDYSDALRILHNRVVVLLVCRDASLESKYPIALHTDFWLTIGDNLSYFLFRCSGGGERRIPILAATRCVAYSGSISTFLQSAIVVTRHMVTGCRGSWYDGGFAFWWHVNVADVEVSKENYLGFPNGSIIGGVKYTSLRGRGGLCLLVNYEIAGEMHYTDYDELHVESW